MVLMIAGLMSTVGVYAAGFGTAPTTNTLSGASVGVSAANTSTTTIAWRFSGTQVDAAKVTWTPQAAGNYDIKLNAGGQTATLNIPTSGTSERVDDLLVLSVPVEASAISTALIIISEN
jgi:hypothetical protein